MLDSLLVCNFRLFKELKINRLSKVNLFVGKNNVGKSCLLEALQVYISAADPGVLLDLALARDGSWETELNQRNEQIYSEAEHPLRYLFYGFHFPETVEGAIKIGSLKNDQDQIRIAMRNDQNMKSNDFSKAKIELELCAGKRKKTLIDLSKDLGDMYRLTGISGIPAQFNFQFIPTRSMTDQKVAILWDMIELTDHQEEIVECLNLMDLRIRSVGLIGEFKSVGPRWTQSRRIPMIRLREMGERLPLKNLGDGVTRLFHLILAMVNARDGFLLIDEFENGLHWTVQPKIWAEVFRLAEKLNVQVFATTHSADCVRAFGEAWSKNKEKGSFHRLNPDSPTRPKVTEYTCDNLSDALETDTEVR
jgi:predicted ATPase